MEQDHFNTWKFTSLQTGPRGKLNAVFLLEDSFLSVFMTKERLIKNYLHYGYQKPFVKALAAFSFMCFEDEVSNL